MPHLRTPIACILALALPLLAAAQEAPGETDTSHGDAMIRAYFEDQVRQIEAGWLQDVRNVDDWEGERVHRRAELLDMLGLAPMPPRTDLEATVTGTLEHTDFTVEKLHFQSMPGLYVTANLYVPKHAEGPLPGVLYVCGHANREVDGVSMGAKTAYQRHAAWFARHGYVALIVDTNQLGEIEGIHHGTYREDRWWWWNRGYTPAGVEVWNGIRALDYLASRPEVDPERLAVAGRSGGGAYSWFLTAVDDRVRAAVPTAGITDLEDHVLDRVVAGHCDCMYMVNRERWDFPALAALSAPRPVLLANGDTDPIFPLDGVDRVFERTETVYDLYGRPDHWERLIVPAAHEDVHAIQQGMYRWLHRHLKGERLAREDSAETYFEPAELKVFDTLPEDEINTRIDELFVAPAPEPALPATWEAWEALRGTWMERLRAQAFAGWPEEGAPLAVEEAVDLARGGLRLRAFDFDSQAPVRLRAFVVEPRGGAEGLTVAAVDEEGWTRWLALLQAFAGDQASAAELVGPGASATPWPAADGEALAALRDRLAATGQALAIVAPRGVGPTAWTESERGFAVRRSFMLLGQTRDGMRVWDVRRAVEALRGQDGLREAPIRLTGEGVMAGIALYAGLFEPEVEELALVDLPPTHRDGPILLNVRKVLDLPQAVGMAATGRRVVLSGPSTPWSWPHRLVDGAPSGAAVLEFTRADPWL